MADPTYTAPILMHGDMIASLTGTPGNNGNPGDANFGIILPGVRALGTPTSWYRLVWYQNVDLGATQFGNGQFWRLERYTPGSDSDGDPATGNNGWSTVSGYEQLVPKHDLVSNLGAGDDYIVLEGAAGFLLYDVRGGLPPSPSTLTYFQSQENGDPATGDNDGQLDFQDAYSAICFGRGTLIDTPAGPRRIETLRPGDPVLTLDHGAQPLRWIGRRDLTAADLARAPNLAPIRIAAGALGPGHPHSDLILSPQHRVLLRSEIAHRLWGMQEVLVAAKHLCPLPGIRQVHPAREVSYFHLLFDRHEILGANGTPAESLYLGRQALRSLTPAARAEVDALFPRMRRRLALPVAARALLSGGPGRRLAERHRQSGQPLFA